MRNLDPISWSLLLFAALAAASALLNVRRAPNTIPAWKLALGASEYGHWLALCPLGIAGLAAVGGDGLLRGVIFALCGLAVAGFLRPAVSAWRRLGRGFSWRRLYWRPKPPAASPQTEVYAAPGGGELKLDFYSPRRDEGSRPAPCLVIIHGGGWDSGDSTQMVEWNHRWAARGWAVAALNYRLANTRRRISGSKRS